MIIFLKTISLVINENETVEEGSSNNIPVISEDTGLLNTPIKNMFQITLETLMNPEIKLGEKFQVYSLFDDRVNGLYKVTAISYTGDSRGNEWFMVVTGTIPPNGRGLVKV